MNIKGWFPLGLTGLISLLSKGLSRVLSTTVLQQCRILQWKTTTTITHNDRKEFPRHDVEQRNLNKKIYTVWFYLYCRKISQSKKESFTWTKQDYKLRTAEELMLLNCGVGEDSWESLGLNARRSNQSILKEILGPGSWVFIGRTDAEAETPVLWPLHVKSWLIGKDWCWEGLGAGGKGDDGGWDGWMASLTRWMWVWVNSGRWWWTGRPGVLQFMGSQRVGHDWAIELNWTEDLSTC